MANDEFIAVEIAYAAPDHVYLIPVNVPAGSNIKQAIEFSTILEQCSDIDLSRNKVGIFSKLKSLDDSVKQGDRIEIYRPLKVDPMEARRRRAKSRDQGSGL